MNEGNEYASFNQNMEVMIMILKEGLKDKGSVGQYK